jgi:hypothetical protein
MDNTRIVWVVVILAALALIAMLAIVSRRRVRARSAELQRRFGPEYHRAVQEMGSPARAERELVARSKRVDKFEVRELNTAERARFAASWSRVQAQFVDDPAVAVASADELINDLMRARGYPTDDFEQRVSDLSVDHPAVVQHYRAAHSLAVSNRSGKATTEDLRQAVVHYRVLFSDLLQESSGPAQSLRDAHA